LPGRPGSIAVAAKSITFTTCGWSSCCDVVASRRKRSMFTSSSATSACRILIATRSCRVSSRASYTRPMPPLAITRRSSKRPATVLVTSGSFGSRTGVTASMESSFSPSCGQKVLPSAG
jgi:hypothetical protein